jgi:hypothetical protein
VASCSDLRIRRTLLGLPCVAALVFAAGSVLPAWGQTQEGPKSTARPPEDGRKPEEAAVEEDWSDHFQTTVVLQGRGAMESPFSGPNSFSENRENATSVTSTLFFGRRLWKNAAIYMEGLMAEVIEGHILVHIVDPNKRAASEQSKAAQDLIDVIKSYLK